MNLRESLLRLGRVHPQGEISITHTRITKGLDILLTKADVLLDGKLICYVKVSLPPNNKQGIYEIIYYPKQDLTNEGREIYHFLNDGNKAKCRKLLQPYIEEMRNPSINITP